MATPVHPPVEPPRPAELASEFPNEPPPRRRSGAVVGRLLLVLLLLAIGGGAVWGLTIATRPMPSGPWVGPSPQFQVDPMFVQPDSQVPAGADGVPAVRPPDTTTGAAPPSGKPTRDSWAAHISSDTDIPVRALVAYANADVVMRAIAPRCHISWASLAGVGRVESKHGRYGGTQLGADGRPERPIIGPALDGSPGLARIPATDGGVLTGDSVWSHAVGPMQFLPSTWAKWGTRASRDGQRPDPQSIDDAALTAARYLCADGRDLATPRGWWAAVLSYNNSVDYGQQVFSAADAYAKVSLGH